MNENRVHIENLEVRLKGISPGTARAVVEGLGDELLQHLSTARSGSLGRSARIDTIDAGQHEMAKGASAEEVRSAIIRRIGDEIERAVTR